MNQRSLVIVVLAAFLAFVGGIRTAIDAKDVQRNARIKEINANVSRGFSLLEKHYLDRAKPFTDVVDLAPSLRQVNNWGNGSCVFATSISLLRWPGDPKLNHIADEWRRKYSGGEATAEEPHTRKMDASGLRYVVTTDGDARLIEWAVATRRGCGVAYPRRHCVAVVGRVRHNGQDCVVLLDNNHVRTFDYVPWQEFISHWKSLGGRAFAFVYVPPPPTPR